MRIALYLPAVWLLCGALPAAAQLPVHLGAHALLSLPVGGFEDFGSEGDGNAQTGFGIGMDFHGPLVWESLHWLASTGGIFNPQDDFTLLGVNVDAGSWFNLPLLAGLKYQGRLPNTTLLGFYGLGQLGMDFAFSTRSEATIAGQKQTAEFDPGIGFAFALGAGLTFNDRFSAGIRFLSLGEPEIDITNKGPFPSEDSQDFTIAVLALTLGMEF